MAKILIIEDEPDAARSIQILLKESGMEAGIALGGKEGLRKMKKGYDVVLLDLIMPRMSGREVLRKMHKQGIGKPVVVVSAVGVPLIVKDELTKLYPGIGFVSKPHMYTDLVKEIRAALAKK